jgi:hypothetical protein
MADSFAATNEEYYKWDVCGARRGPFRWTERLTSVCI